MAEVMNSLFGVTPESLMSQRNNALQAQALQYAQLDPFQRATAGIYAGANQLGGAVGGMLGAQDPELQRVTQRQSMLQQAQPTDAKSWGALASQLMQSGDIRGAQEAYAKSQSLQSLAIKQGLDTSTMASNLATAANKQFEISPQGRGQELAKQGKFTSNSIADFIEGKGQLVAIDKFAKPSADFIAKAVELKFGDKPAYGDYSAEQAGKVNAALLEEALRLKKEGKTDIVLPGQPVGPKDWLKFREFTDTNPIMQKTSTLLSELPAALETIRMSTNNDIAAASMPSALASLAGEGKNKSDADIQRYVKTGGLDDRLIGSAVSFISGRGTQTKKQEALKYASAMYRGVLLERKKFIQSEARQLGYDKSPNYDQAIADIDAELAKFKKPSEMKDSGTQSAPVSGYSEAQINATLQKYQQPK